MCICSPPHLMESYYGVDNGACTSIYIYNTYHSAFEKTHITKRSRNKYAGTEFLAVLYINVEAKCVRIIRIHTKISKVLRVNK